MRRPLLRLWTRPQTSRGRPAIRQHLRILRFIKQHGVVTWRSCKPAWIAAPMWYDVDDVFLLVGARRFYWKGPIYKAYHQSHMCCTIIQLHSDLATPSQSDLCTCTLKRILTSSAIYIRIRAGIYREVGKSTPALGCSWGSPENPEMLAGGRGIVGTSLKPQ